MSHQPERKEKNCLNCGTDVLGRYCHQCGQENITTRQGFLSLTKHFIYDIFHFDGKFFDTLTPLFLRPGRVAKQYVSGRRTAFLDPIRMYLFTSALFFLIFFSFAKSGMHVQSELKKEASVPNDTRLTLADTIQKSDTGLPAKTAMLGDSSKKNAYKDLNAGPVFSLTRNNYSSVKDYDEAQEKLPPNERDNFIKKMLVKKGIETDAKFKGDFQSMLQVFWEPFLHRLPYLFFLSLPFFALLLKLIYIRRPAFYFSDHAVFTLYHYIFSFMLMIVMFTLNKLQEWLHWEFLNYVLMALFAYLFFYLYKSMRNFYGQSRQKTLVKFFILSFSASLILCSLLLSFIFFSILQM